MKPVLGQRVMPSQYVRCPAGEESEAAAIVLSCATYNTMLSYPLYSSH